MNDTHKSFAIYTTAAAQKRLAIKGSKLLRGANKHHGGTVLRMRIDMGGLDSQNVSAAGADFLALHGAWLATLATREPTTDTRPGNSRLDSPPPEIVGDMTIADVLFASILAVERSMREIMRRLWPISYAQILDTKQPPIRDFVWTTDAPRISRSAVTVAIAALSESLPPPMARLLPRTPASSRELLSTLEASAERLRWAQSTAIAVDAAKRQGIPYETLGEAYVRVGQGALQWVIYTRSSNLDSACNLSATGDLGATGAQVPSTIVVGARGTSSIARDLDGILRASGRVVGLATKRHATLDGEPLAPSAMGRQGALRFMLTDPRVESFINATTPQKILTNGLRIDACTVAAVLDPASAREEKSCREAIAVLARANPTVIVNATSPVCDTVTAQFATADIILVGNDRDEPKLAHHAALGGRSVVVIAAESGHTMALRRGHETVLEVAVKARPTTAGNPKTGARAFALACTWGLGLPRDEIAGAYARRAFMRK